MPELFESNERVAQRAGLSADLVRQWCRQGLITPTWVTPAGQPRWHWSDFLGQLRLEGVIEAEQEQ